jgi:hypothetical protein
MGVQVFDGLRHAVLVDPDEIRAAEDWMRDCGRLRLVESVEASPVAGSVLVRFSDAGDGAYATLSVPQGVTVTVWRALAETGAAARAQA